MVGLVFDGCFHFVAAQLEFSISRLFSALDANIFEVGIGPSLGFAFLLLLQLLPYLLKNAVFEFRDLLNFILGLLWLLCFDRRSADLQIGVIGRFDADLAHQHVYSVLDLI